ncbi:MAG: aromatic amino acid lyase [bacterium]|nr:aromatic amino acid lyase [bacterium]
MAAKEVVINGADLTIDQVHEVSRLGAVVKVAPEAFKAIEASRKVIEKKVAAGLAVYGVTTGIGEFARIQISPEQGMELQKRIVYSHAAAVGKIIPEEDVRAAMLLRVNCLSKGYSGVRPLIVETLVAMLNKGVHPVVYQKGSLGTSGDLSPLSMIAEVVMGEGRAFYKGKMMPGGEAMKAAGIAPVVLSFKEGLGIINGTQAFTGVGVLAIYDAIGRQKRDHCRGHDG